MGRAIRAVLMAVVLAVPAVAAAQDYAMPGGVRDFRVESQAVKGRRGTVLSGYVYNDSCANADKVQILIEGLDGATVTSRTTAYVTGLVPGSNRRYFEVPLTTPPAPAYRAKVVWYEVVGRGGV